jgi:hypothetical protein
MQMKSCYAAKAARATVLRFRTCHTYIEKAGKETSIPAVSRLIRPFENPCPYRRNVSLMMEARYNK